MKNARATPENTHKITKKRNPCLSQFTLFSSNNWEFTLSFSVKCFSTNRIIYKLLSQVQLADNFFVKSG